MFGHIDFFFKLPFRINQRGTEMSAILILKTFESSWNWLEVQSLIYHPRTTT